ncbi:MAG: UDP-N-acetylmuramoyl-L-alanyl-D-glutamate--2,6-diaminopimelate ligase [Candidatus Hydrogenedentes bacterium]|nr:UDP-N-acetylmuramoyl-L-alanyl-D-glutamate--2,6-diaminopimelate ligase [Candidatus Hydrogenedentota bacterium]
MKLCELPSLLGCDPSRALPATEIAVVTEDSRRVVPGSVFVAARGIHADGHDYAAAAARAGAVAVIGERPGIASLDGLPYLCVPHARKALGTLAHALAGNPTERMTVIGVTGTNGKSSTVILVHHILNACGHSTACLGTLGYRIGSELLAAPHTTPFGEDLATLFRRAADARHSHAVMEVSSHALDQERVAGIVFKVGAFTNLTQDHLDYHQNMDAYRRAKLRLFEEIVGPERFTVVNRDDASADAFISASQVPCVTFGAKGDCRATQVRTSTRGAEFRAATPWGAAEIALPLLGRHNVSNALCAIATCGGLRVSLDGIAESLRCAPPAPGRFEHVDTGQPFQVVVDYAHTEDGLRNVLQAAREICKGRIICVFGCGGDRDRSKRPKMAAVAAALADLSILTSDNPRTEDPERILLDIETGMQRVGKKKNIDYLVFVNRAEAIRRAIDTAQAGDFVMIAGKGHEDYQILGTQRIHFDDREVARDVLEGR